MAQTGIIDALRANLEAEREALLTGRFGGLGDLAEEREALLGQLQGTPAEALRDLKGNAERNRALQAAAADGIRDAMRRLQAMREAQGPIGGYTQTGDAMRIGTARTSVERKA
ncbi:hypothetical protein [Ovoidimarina sediminis]|uniref:hypothetical protein n=1 Tax=Ovoidimarina sediminis TaxID=3079856 RepID=UPI00290CB792|nr:hypothetical protein [Rhodophyticola sp. MJ-SS7]MDU8942580.1 hypothetical protein [Rhodophyticola sp. MJ-SS7]